MHACQYASRGYVLISKEMDAAEYYSVSMDKINIINSLDGARVFRSIQNLRVKFM